MPANRGLTYAARSGNDQERQLEKSLPETAFRADRVRAGRVDYFVGAINTTLAANVYHGELRLIRLIEIGELRWEVV
jgi:hypothetical protein